MLQSLWSRALGHVFVAGCAACDATAGEPMARTGLCPRCAESLYEVGPACPRCAEPIAGPVALVCRRCRVRPLPFARALAPYRYGGELAVALRRLKYQRRPDIARALAPLLAPGLGLMAAHADVAVPVPLHWRRMMQRGFNQAALLLELAKKELAKQELARCGGPARLSPLSGVSGVSGLAIDKLCLRRVRATAPQNGLSVRERAANMTAAFAVPPRYRARVAGARVLVVDDIMTTGATLAACARALLDSGAVEVTALAMARAES